MRNDIERVLIDEAVIEKRLDTMAAEIERDFPSGTLVVIILLKGALVFAADLLRRVPRALEIECLNVASYHGGTESSGKVDFLDRHFPEVKGHHVLLLDDILDTGRTLHAVKQRLIEEGALVDTRQMEHHRCRLHFLDRRLARWRADTVDNIRIPGRIDDNTPQYRFATCLAFNDDANNSVALYNRSDKLTMKHRMNAGLLHQRISYKLKPLTVQLIAE